MNQAQSKTVFFAFRGDAMCFIHVLLNGLDMAEQGMEGKIVIEGEAVRLVPAMAAREHFLHQPFVRAREQGLIVGACRACSTKLGVADAVSRTGVELIGDMAGHPAMAPWLKQGYRILTF
ncbi:MAG TPA: cytoplasmic protein [Desulfobulbus sp.]|nr:cytoplasmic protein [Desulfobulbus sp.]